MKQYIAEILTGSTLLFSQVLSSKPGCSVLASKQPMETTKVYVACESNKGKHRC